MRELTQHRVNGMNEQLRVFVLDAPGSGGACHRYAILWPSSLQPGEYPPENRRQPEKVYDMPGNLGYLYLYSTDGIAEILDRETASTLFHYVEISFQNGPIKEAGVNGLSHEALIAILCDRLQGFQSGPYAGRENACALTKLDEARMWLQLRTSDRIARGVEGTHGK